MSLKNVPKKRLGEILVEEGYLSPKELEKGLEIQKKEGGLIGSILIRMEAITEDELVAALAKQLSLPFIRLSSYSVNPAVLKQVSREAATSFLLFPFDEDESAFYVAVSDPLNKEAFQTLEKSVSSRIQVFLSTPTEIKSSIELYYGGSIEPRETGRGSRGK